jgi:hypothetical protein
MGKTWVLHTETKGTGANMVPLDRVTRRRADPEPVFVPAKPRPRPPEPPKPRAPRRFKVVDVMTNQPMVEDAQAGAAIDVLKDVRSIVDVDAYVWHDERDRWRRLTFPELRAMWDLAKA